MIIKEGQLVWIVRWEPYKREWVTGTIVVHNHNIKDILVYNLSFVLGVMS